MKHSKAEDETIAQASLYALGALNQNEARAFEEHLAEECEACADEVRYFQSVVTAIGFGAAEVQPPASVREKLASIIAPETKPEVSGLASMRASLKQFFSMRANEGEWRELSQGLLEKQLFVDQHKGTVTTLIKLLPGVKLPSHRHLGVEECLVLEGDFHVNDEVFGPGDYRCAMPDSIDQSPYSVNGTLLLIVAQQGYELLAQ